VTTLSPVPPGEIEALARERADARAAGDYARADALRARIEAAGWRLVDHGIAFRLEPAAPPTIEDGDVVRYGSADAVPSLLDEPATAPFTVVALAADRPDDTTRLLAGLRAHAPAGTQVVIVANEPPSAPASASSPAPDGADVAPVAGSPPELLRTSVRLGHAAALNIGMRRARGSIVVLVDPSIEPTGDALGPLADALADPSVAVAGGSGVAGAGLRHLVEAPGPDVDAIVSGWCAFRRSDVSSLGPLDERFVLDAHLDVWWSLVLRTGRDAGRPARRAVRIDLPLVLHERREDATLPVAERERLAKRNFYRVLDQFRERTDLFSGSSSS
jgi:hypothetical protein